MLPGRPAFPDLLVGELSPFLGLLEIDFFSQKALFVIDDEVPASPLPLLLLVNVSLLEIWQLSLEPMMDDTVARGDRFEVVCLRPEIHSTMVNLFIFCEVEGFMAAILASSPGYVLHTNILENSWRNFRPHIAS